MKKMVSMLLVVLTGCSSCVYKPIDERSLDFEKLSNEFFSKYDFDFESRLNKSNIVTSNVFIRGDKFLNSDFEKVKLKIDKTWRLVYSSQDQYVYCYNRYNEMAIVNPKHLNYYNKFSEKLYLTREDVGNWVILFTYDEDGTDYCKDEEFN
ncbi:hypothetical protein GCM10025882_22270 [Acinetobacter gyllenbergii]|uniref:Lipoprotein n=1 Tax=Acinetobacter gyllenbergii CIP 110306 = MTCC 11365 TaxID=1217657 RepID=A0A829HB58_9GAMM|nr:hypothetical protein [Acinetobacter gyllenbergii]EPF71644.1 hypothetical protein F957_03830 [Acinetobacter gyllenbergii CIP 110306 = MTCC 11365]GMA11802.1 hypothetical protein GCM10025882_22270 [Acinetobacter gyllenbergii]